MIMEAALHSRVANHYAHGDLVGAIRDGLGRIGCGLGGPARQIAAHYGCQVDGIDPTRDYVEACNVLSEWLHLNECVSLQQGDALALPFTDSFFSAAYMLHVGMNIADKSALFAEAARPAGGRAVRHLRPDAHRRWRVVLPAALASTAYTNAIVSPGKYRNALSAAGFEIVSERERRDVALDYFARQRAQAAAAPSALGVHTLIGARRPEMVRNMSGSISASQIAPVELIARRN